VTTHETFSTLIEQSQIPILRSRHKEQSDYRQFFCKLATLKGFDPLVAENWKQIKQKDIIDAGVS
jgi:hypothetical protein